MAHLEEFPKPSEGLKAITINGSVVVESEEDIRRREERRKNRKSRWGAAKEISPRFCAPQPKKSTIVLEEEEAAAKVRKTINPQSDKSSDGDPSSSVKKLQPDSVLPTQIDASTMDEKSQQIYILKLQIQEASTRLSKPDLGIPKNPKERSPSPEPIYNNKGVRINTRFDRVKSQLVNQRNAAITKLKQLDPTYQPPSAFQYKNAQLEDKVMIPSDEYPHINFVGLLLGPRGNFLEQLKEKTKCNIVIRGKGSIKAGMTGIKGGKKLDSLDEPMHAFITGSTAEDVKKAVKEVQDLIDMQIYNPDCEKAVALRSKHMYELAVLNGTLKDLDYKCLNCGKPGHTAWNCQESKIFTASVICNSCGGVGHITKDCKQRRPGAVFNSHGDTSNEILDKEYESFLSDVDPSFAKSKRDSADKKSGYVPPMGNLSQSLEQSQAPLMLTNGSSAPGAASAHARAISSGTQMAGGKLTVMGTSIFGGKMTRLTAGYKSHDEMEMERKKKVEEYNNRPVPLHWQVEKYEQEMGKQQEQYIQNLEKYCKQQKALKQAQSTTKKKFGAPPPPPPGLKALRPGGLTQSSNTLSDDQLPSVIGAPLSSIKSK